MPARRADRKTQLRRLKARFLFKSVFKNECIGIDIADCDHFGEALQIAKQQSTKQVSALPSAYNLPPAVEIDSHQVGNGKVDERSTKNNVRLSREVIPWPSNLIGIDVSSNPPRTRAHENPTRS